MKQKNLSEKEIGMVEKFKMALKSIDHLTFNLVLSKLPIRIKHKLLTLFKFAPSLKQDLIHQARLYPDIISHLYEILYFLTSDKAHVKVQLTKGEDNYLITIFEKGEMYKFKFNLFPSSKIPFANDLTPLVDIFSRKLYDFYPVKGRIVDIGGYIGDTATYFVKKGANSVEVYEPSPYNYDFLIKNLELNNVLVKVKPFNLAVSRNCGDSVLFIPKFSAGEASIYAADENSITLNVNTISCQEVLNKHIDLLKMDCKGCEVDIILHCGQLLKENVDHLIFQYSDISEKSLSTMLEKLRNIGFIVDKVDHDYRMVYAQMPKRKSSN